MPIVSDRTVAEITGAPTPPGLTHEAAIALMQHWVGKRSDLCFMRALATQDGTHSFAVGLVDEMHWPGWALWTVSATDKPSVWTWQLERRGFGVPPWGADGALYLWLDTKNKP